MPLILENHETALKLSRPLAGLNALVTGSSRGIGRAIALALAEQGANVAVHCRVNANLAQICMKECQEKHEVESAVFEADVADKNNVAALAENVLKRFGRIDILVNNAGITRDKSFLKMDEIQWSEVITTDLTSLFQVTRAFAGPMVENKWGRIINISSVVGQMGGFGQANYAAAKAGVIGLTKTLSRELASKGITVNAIAPGYIATTMVSAMPEEAKSKILESIPLKRFGTPEEIAWACCFLANPRASYVTGTVLDVNGGVHL